uniref:Tubby-related protein 4 n=1 Tax=Daphnia galeata TaxID=27404 RepID=A0A8J2RH17_9CRUS|nr:unnamed protein product [Daphnia galeata]
MHLHFEEPSSQLRCDSVINSLSWMGRVPDEQPEGHGWKLNRTSYYQEGWLAAGNNRSVVGVTFTSTLPHRNNPTGAAVATDNEISGSSLPLPPAPPHLPLPPRTNYNLRGHRAQISLVRWNEPYQKLATCDASGIIFVWIRYEGRWSIELINDRNTPVTHFSWSHDGRMAVIAYQDGFVLVGSVAGQRYWSTVLNQESIITTGTWTPDDQQVYLGTSSGSIVVLDVHNGAVIAQIQMSEPSSSLSAGSVSSSASANGIRQLAWNCPRFKMEEPTSTASTTMSNGNGRQTGAPSTDGHLLSSLSGGVEDQHHVLAVLTAGGRLSLIKGFDDVHPCSAMDEDDEDEANQQQRTGAGQCGKGGDPCWNKGPLSSPMMEWNNDGELLCLGGHHHIQSSSAAALHHYANILQFYNSRGVLRFRIAVPYTQAPITSFTWGHNDRRLFVATGCAVHVAWVSPRRIASLQHLARLKLRRCLTGPDQLEDANFAERVPRLIRNLVVSLFSSTVHCHVPEEHRIRDYVCRPPPGNTRLYCTMIRRDEEDSPSVAGCHGGGGGVDGLIDPIDPAAAATGGGGVGFTLYLEFLGGLIPLLKGKPTSRIRPEFVIYDPRKSAINETNKVQPLVNKNSELFLAPPQPSGSKFHQLLSPGLRRKFRRHRPDDDSDSETDDSCVSTPRLHRKFGGKKQVNNQSVNPQNSGDINEVKSNGQEQSTLAEVASNIWGTRFKITGMAPSLPSHLGQITYKTSLLHLQPRQMTLGVVDLRDSSPGTEVDDEDPGPPVFICPSDDEEHAKVNREQSSRQHPPIVPLTTPNLRLRRKAGRNRMEPPPSPTHHRRPVQQQPQHQSTPDEILRIEWNNQSESRIVLSAPAVRWRSQSAGHLATINSSGVNNRTAGRRRKSRSLDSSPVLGAGSNRSGDQGLPGGVRSSWAVQMTQPAIPKGMTTDKKTNTNSFRSRVGSQVLQVQHVSDSETNNKVNKEKRFALARLSPLFGRKCPSSAGKSTAGRSEPNSPNPSPSIGRRRNNSSATVKNERRHQSPIRQLLNSPLLARRLGKNRFAPPAAATAMTMDSSDDDIDDPQATTVHNFHDLESFQKAQLLNKLRQTWIAEKNAATANKVEEREPPAQMKRRCEFVLNNKAPLWNEHSQVYQLDFGGRVTQESAKNFQIEFKGKQVMQFGRIDGNAYTLDFQYPFSAVQAFAVALANVTQRLK